MNPSFDREHKNTTDAIVWIDVHLIFWENTDQDGLN
jgi:hypothetical protein